MPASFISGQNLILGWAYWCLFDTLFPGFTLHLCFCSNCSLTDDYRSHSQRFHVVRDPVILRVPFGKYAAWTMRACQA